MALATVEYDHFLDVVRSLTPDEWRRATECERWDVRDVATHVLGATESHSSIREFAHQIHAYRSAKSGAMIDALNALQVRDRAELAPEEIVTRLERAAPRSITARRRMPAPLRHVRVKVDPPFEGERWSIAYLMDVIYTRDTWMHRVDINRATGRAVALTREHDGRLVAGVVAEWAHRHGRPFTLILTNPAGGTYTAGEGGEPIEMDAVDFCRTTSGRAPGTGLLATPVGF
jgi:uncharacterized protein (TIGR03083 family)